MTSLLTRTAAFLSFAALSAPGWAQAPLRSRAQTPTAPAAAEFFPLAVGNFWIFASEGRFAGDSMTVRITGIESTEQCDYYRLEGWSDEALMVRMTPEGQLVARDERGGAESLLYDFAAPVGKSWTPFAGGECPAALARVESRDETIETPAGVFENAFVVGYSGSNCADAGLSREAFASRVGPISRESLTIAGPRRMLLQQASVDGRIIAGPGVAFSMSAHPVRFESPGDDRPPLNVVMTIANRSSEPIELNFMSGQRFDVAVRDEAGETVALWSATRLFPQITGSLEIGPGGQAWTAELSMPDSLPSGVYTVEGWLTNDGPRRFSATVSVEILTNER